MHHVPSPEVVPSGPRRSTRGMRLYLFGVLIFLILLHVGLVFNFYPVFQSIF